MRKLAYSTSICPTFSRLTCEEPVTTGDRLPVCQFEECSLVGGVNDSRGDTTLADGLAPLL